MPPLTESEAAVLKSLVEIDTKIKKAAASPESAVIEKSRETTGNCLISTLVPVLDGRPDFRVHVYEDSDWDEGIRELIPNIDPYYMPNPLVLYCLLLAWELKDPVLVYGPTGSGKTSIVRHACALTRRPYLRVNGKGDMESAPLFGQPSVDVDPETGLNKSVWNDGVVTEGAKMGAVLLFDEPFATPAHIQLGLNPLLEDDGKLVLDEKSGPFADKIVKPHDRFRIVYCDNTGGLGDTQGSFAGVNVQNTSTLDRFKTVLYMDYLSSSEECKILTKRFPEIPSSVVKKMVQFATLVRNNFKGGELSLTMSPRALFSWCEKSLILKSVPLALQIAFYRKFNDLGEQQTLGKHYMTVFGENPF